MMKTSWLRAMAKSRFPNDSSTLTPLAHSCRLSNTLHKQPWPCGIYLIALVTFLRGWRLAIGLLRSATISARVRISSAVFIMAILENTTLFSCYLWMALNCIKASSRTAGSIYGLFSISLWTLAIRRNTCFLGEFFLAQRSPRTLILFFSLVYTTYLHSRKRAFMSGMGL